MIPFALHAELPPALVAGSAALRPPAVVAPQPREASFGWVAGRAAFGPVRVRVLVDGVQKGTKGVQGASPFSFSLDLPPRDVRIRVVAEAADGERAAATVTNVRGLPREARPGRMGRSLEDRKLARRVRALARDFRGTAAVYVQDLSTGRGAAWNARAKFPAASTLKLAIAVEALRRERGRPSSGSQLDSLLRAMLVHSDNEAANRLLVRIGGSTSGGSASVNALLRSLGIRESHLYGGYGTTTVAAAGRPIPLRVNEQPSFGVGKHTTAWDLARLHRFVHLATRGLGPLPRTSGSFGRADARYLVWILARVSDPGKLDRFLPRATTVTHKAGWLRQARHDAGIVFWQEGSFVAAVLTWNASGVGTGADVLAGRVARAALVRFRELRAAADGGRTDAWAASA
ncbi:MAG TPA: serine hydrolase [Gaiellaceae bacterium]|nr:serine hydrolase [Gaiellaceae bacterium]